VNNEGIEREPAVWIQVSAGWRHIQDFTRYLEVLKERTRLRKLFGWAFEIDRFSNGTWYIWTREEIPARMHYRPCGCVVHKGQKHWYKDFKTGKLHWTRKAFVGWTLPSGPLQVHYAMFASPYTDTLCIPQYLLTKETLADLPPPPAKRGTP